MNKKTLYLNKPLYIIKILTRFKRSEHSLKYFILIALKRPANKRLETGNLTLYFKSFWILSNRRLEASERYWWPEFEFHCRRRLFIRESRDEQSTCKWHLIMSLDVPFNVSRQKNCRICSFIWLCQIFIYSSSQLLQIVSIIDRLYLSVVFVFDWTKYFSRFQVLSNILHNIE